MAINDTYRLTAVWRREANPHVAINHFHFLQTASIHFPTPPEDLVDAFVTFVQDQYLAMVTDFMVLERYQVAKAPDFFTEYEAIIEEPGTLTGDPLPPTTSLFIRTRTALFTKSGRGGLFLPPAVESVNTNGHPTGSYLTSASQLIENLIVDMAGDAADHAGWLYRVWSPTLGVGNQVLSGAGLSGWSHQVDRRFIY